MSIKSALIGMLLFLGAFLSAYGLQIYFGGEVYSRRSPAANEDAHIRNLKEQILLPKQGNSPIFTEKLRGPLKIKILGPSDDFKGSPSGNLTLRLQLQSEESLGSVQVKWILPVGVSFISGDGAYDGKSSVLEIVSISKDEIIERVVDLHIADNGNYQVHVQASSNNQMAHFTEVAQYNTLFESFIHSGSKSDQLEKSSIEESSLPQFKVFE